MKRTVLKFMLAAIVTGMSLPVVSFGADDNLINKIEQLSREIEQLKNQVKANEEKTIKAAEEQKSQARKSESKEIEELKSQVKRVEDKSIGKWLTIGGDYRFRIDSLHGETVSYTNAPAFMGALQKDPVMTGFFSNPQTQALLSTKSYSGVAGLTPDVMMGNIMNYLTAPTSAGGAGLTPAAAQAKLQQLGGGAFVQAYKPKNETLYTNRFGLDLHAKATQDITVNVKLDMYKSFGSQNDAATTGNFFADRVGVFDGTLSHVPSSSLLNVDRAYATWSNIADQPLWFSVGRRPSTNGAPTNLKLNNERPGNGGTPALLVDYAFDGMTLGYAPDIDMLPGAYAKVCYGRGFDSGLKTSSNSIKDTDMLGIAVIPVDTDPLRVWLQWNRGFNIFDFPAMSNTAAFGTTAPSVNLGDIDWYGAGVMSTFKNVGPGNLNLFTDLGLSITHPNNNVSANAGFQGLMTGGFLAPEAPKDKTGWAVYAGIRYDLPSKTKIGFEFNHGSKDWITFAPSADDMWTSKVGTRGNVFEPYVIQELNLKPISSYLSKAFFKIGYQYYDFEYSGSNNWVGAPKKISSIQPSDMMLLTPMKSAHDIYGTFEVHF